MRRFAPRGQGGIYFTLGEREATSRFQKSSDSRTSFGCLSGHETVGGTIILIEQGGEGLLLDFGMDFARHAQFYDGYVGPRAAQGIEDYWDVGVIPRNKCLYRSDIMPRDKDWSLDDQGNIPVSNVYFSHVHQDHIGIAGALRRDLNFYMSAESAAIAKGVQDTSPSDVMGQYAYTIPREHCGESVASVKASSRNMPAEARPLFVLNCRNLEAVDKLWNTPVASDSRSRPFSPTPVRDALDQIGSFKVEAWPVDHSIPGCLGLIVHADCGPTGYTGDLRMHGKNSHLSEAFLNRMCEMDIRVLFIEHTTVDRTSSSRTTEEDVRDHAMEIVQNARGDLIAADFGSKHFERMFTFLEIAEKEGRQLVIFPKDLYILEQLCKVDPSWDLSERQWLLLHTTKQVPNKWERLLKERHGDKLIDLREVNKYQGDLILAMSYFDVPLLSSLKPKGFQYIYSSSEAYSEGARVDLFRLANWVDHKGGKLHGYSWEGDGERGAPVYTDGLNASGHIFAEDLRDLVREVQPDVLVPVHGQNPAWFLEALKGTKTKVKLAEDVTI